MTENYFLEMRNITKIFPGTVALDQVSFFVKKGEVHCLVGANGAGKSTLIKILSGVYQLDQGEIYLDGQKVDIKSPSKGRELGISVVYQELSLVPELSVAENIFLGIYPIKAKGILDWSSMNNKAQKVIDNLGIKIDVKDKVKNLSVGHQQMVELAKALIYKSKIIVMDEPSAALSSNEFEAMVRVIKKLRSNGITIIYISHRLEEIFKIGDRITILKDGKHVITSELDELNEEKIAELMMGKSFEERVRELDKQFSKGKIILEANNLSNIKLNRLSIRLHEKEILGLYGLVGSGRTELLRVLFGIDQADEGEIYVFDKKVNINSPQDAINLGIGLVPEERKAQGLILSGTVWENIIISSIDKFTHNHILDYKKIFKEVDKQIKSLNIKTSSKYEKVKNLSGGNQQKVVISKWLVNNSKILFLDEPTQGIDVGAKSELYNLLEKLVKEEDKGVIIASSDLDELLKVCDRILVLYEGEVVDEFEFEEFDEYTLQQCAILGRRNVA